ncbi:MAG: NAD-dependent protein deacylase [Lentisphaerae bacterium]|jgi:NAD-dependent deacetylase|nr:NAD-dependent protein deacylase [Lentisphaerota bacterium]
MSEKPIDKLVELLQTSKKCLAFTGAGVSTLSGIPDFRGPNGVYAQKFQSWTVEELHDIRVFRSHPDVFYQYARNSWYLLDTLKANIVHQVLADLEAAGRLQAVYTQNIDMLHQQAGSKRVEEIHGTLATHSCLECGKKFKYPEIKKIVMTDKVPYCDRCRGLIKPDVIFFGEMLDQDLLERGRRDFSEADLVLVLGSSLTVQPAASLPLLAIKNHSKLVIVNSQPTPYDQFATLLFQDLKQVFDAINRKWT